MATKIGSKIAAWEVVSTGGDPAPAPTLAPERHKPPKRPQVLDAQVFKIKSHHYPHAFYVTVSMRYGRPWEIFINTGNDNLEMYLKALSRAWSAVMRVEEDITFLIEGAMLPIHDPKGAHSSDELDGSGKQKWHNSVIAEVGYILTWLIATPNFQRMSADGLASLDADPAMLEPESGTYLDMDCPECNEKTMRMVDGCPTCNCGYSKCG
ncbi:hypothetical protein N9937_01540 [bacterium]|nr:hypothetical protein [bacterium]